MKKTMALLLSVLLVISTITCMFTVTTASAEETAAVELISNGDFENTSLQAVGANFGGISGKTDPSVFLDGKWYRATGGHGYSKYGDLTAYNASTLEATKATATEYAKYFTACDTVITQPDDATNHIGRAQQTLYQALALEDGETYTFKFKARTTEGTPHISLRLAGLQTNGTNITDMTYTKMTFDVLAQSDGYTLTRASDGSLKIVFDNPTQWTNVEFVAKVSDVENPTPSSANQTVINTEFTMLGILSDSTILDNTDAAKAKDGSGYYYRKQGTYLDDVSVKKAIYPIGEAEIYKDGVKMTNSNEYAAVKCTVNGQSVVGISNGDEVTATVDYADTGALKFMGWYKDDTLVTTSETLAFTANTTDIYVPKFVNKNLLDAGSFEGFAATTSVQVADYTKYPNEGEWGISNTKGYYGATYDEIIYDKNGYAYQQTASNTASAGSCAATVVSGYAYKGFNSLNLNLKWHTMMTGFNVEPDTNYTLTYYVLASTDTTMKYSGISTTVNVAYQHVPNPLDGGTADMAVALGNMGPAYAVNRVASVAVSKQTWKKVTHTFNSGNFEKLYLCICPSGGELYYIDELTLTAEEKLETLDVKVVDANGAELSSNELANVSAKAEVAVDELAAVKTAVVNYERDAYTFLGWYNANDELLGTAESLTVTGSTDGMYAKIKSLNLLGYAASYEGYANNTQLKYTGTDYPSGVYFGGGKNAGYLGVTYAETIYDNKGSAIQQIASGTRSTNNISAVVTGDKAHSGDKSVYLKNGFWTAGMGIDVEPNTNYVLSYYILAPKDDAGNLVNTIQLSAIATSLNTGTGGATGAKQPINQATNLYLDSATLTNLHDGENWVKVTHSFNSMNLNKVYLIIGQTAYGDTGNVASWAYIDDMSMIETVPTTMDVDMKSCASLDLIDAKMDGLYVNQQLTFKVIDNMETDATVTLNGKAVAPNADGSYTVILREENALSVRFAGDENLPNHDEDEFGRKLNVNNHAVYSEPVWEGDTVYHETALFTPDKDTVKLLYPVDSIVSLRSYDLRTNYIEGYDFEITADGQIKRLEGGRIPVWQTSLVSDTDTDWDRTDGKYVVLTGDTTYPKYAISVTYKHSTTFEDGFTPAKPESQYASINNVMQKLEKGEEVNIVIYGDSISCGWSSSSLTPDIKIYDETNTEGNYITRYNINVAPWAPTWFQMLETELKTLYPNAKINFKNLALGGKSSPWGAQNIAARLALWKDEEGNQVTPDLMLVGFGVNDSAGGITTANFKANMEAIVANARAASGNSEMEVLMYSPMFPNQDAVNWPAERLLGYEAAMEEIAVADQNVGLLKLSSIFNEIVKNKAPEDYLNTNLNHGNDFTARLYYTGLVAAMEKCPDAELLPEVSEIFADGGVSIRKIGEVAGKPQALRYKINISRDVLSAEHNGYTITEYGAIIAAGGKYGEALDLDDVAAGVAKKGIAYSAANGTETLFEQTETTNTYTMALYNIGAIKDDNGDVVGTDYTKWGVDYCVRGYVVFSAEGKEDIIVYADKTVSASVFDVFDAILAGSKESDIEYINLLLTKEEISKAYSDFKANAY